MYLWSKFVVLGQWAYPPPRLFLYFIIFIEPQSIMRRFEKAAGEKDRVKENSLVLVVQGELSVVAHHWCLCESGGPLVLSPTPISTMTCCSSLLSQTSPVTCIYPVPTTRHHPTKSTISSGSYELCVYLTDTGAQMKWSQGPNRTSSLTKSWGSWGWSSYQWSSASTRLLRPFKRKDTCLSPHSMTTLFVFSLKLLNFSVSLSLFC